MKQNDRRVAVLESLEDRFMPAFVATFTAGLLRFVSDNSSDQLVVRGETDGSISFQSNADPFQAVSGANSGNVTKISVEAGGGDDVVDLTGFNTAPIALLSTTAIQVSLDQGNDKFLGSKLAESIIAGDGQDSVQAGDGADTVLGGLGNDQLSGDQGNDLIIGDAGLDQLLGGEGHDLIFGLDDNDLIFGELGNDSIDSGNGDDSIDGGAGNDLIFGLVGNDLIFGGDGNDGIDGGLGFDAIDGNGGDDFILGQDGSDVLFGSAGNDSIDAGAGDDSVAAGEGADLAFGSGGSDRIFGEGGNDSLDGNDGNDSLSAGGGIDLVFGSGNDDLIFGEAGSDKISGGSGSDAIDGGVGNDLIFGDSQNDTLYGWDGDDSLAGGSENDSIYAGLGKNVAYGESGDDSLNGSDDDYLSGGSGTDIVYGASRSRIDDDLTTFVPFPGSEDTGSGGGGTDTLPTSLGNHSQALFGLPWTNGNLTVAFVPDGTKIGNLSSDLNATFNAKFSQATWKDAFYRAFQTWGSLANINFGFVADNGVPIGSAASVQGDLVQADIRIGGAPISSEAYAFTVPPDGTFAGTWSGDIFFNTKADFQAPGVDLYTIALHEIGHSLGLFDNDTAQSAMQYPYSGALQGPSANDVQLVRDLYGARKVDQFEKSEGNDSFNHASRLDFGTGGNDGELPVIGFGDLTTSTDLDFFEIRTVSGYSGPMTVRLRTTGLSLLAPKITVYRGQTEILGTAVSISKTGDDLQILIPAVNSDDEYFVKVEAANASTHNIGSYALIVTLNGRLTTTQTQIETFLRLPGRDLKPGDIQKYFEDPANFDFNDDLHTDDSIETSKSNDDNDNSLQTSSYAFVGSIVDATDIDFYSAVAPSGQTQPLSLIASVRAVNSTGFKPKIEVLNVLGNVLPTEILAHENGTYIVQLQNTNPLERYFFRVTSETGQTTFGNYELGVRFTLNAAANHQQIHPTLTANNPAFAHSFYVAQTQLFHLGVAIDALPNGAPLQGVEAAIYNQQGQLVKVIGVLSGETQTASGFLLDPGTYTIRLLGVTDSGAPISTMNVHVRLVTLSEQTGPLLSDPSGQPIFPFESPGGFTYPNGQKTTRTFLVTSTGTPASVGASDIDLASLLLFGSI